MMLGAAFGLDLASEHPRRVCPDCGSRLLLDAAALDVLVELDGAARELLADIWRSGGSVYACAGCGLGGAFSAPIWVKSC